MYAIKLIVAALHLLILDALTKELAIHHLLKSGVSSVPVIPGFFDLTYVENQGCAWGMFQGQVWPLAVFAILVMVLLVVRRKDFFFTEGPSWCVKTSSVAETMLYAGILGNLIDRIWRGYVVDFFNFHWREAYYFPCFNVADILITCSAFLLIFLSFAAPKPKKNSKLPK